MKGKGNIIYRLLALASMCMVIVASCVRVEIEEFPEIGEGISDVRFDVEFRPLDSVDPATRTAGDAVKHIESVHVVVYKTDSTLFSNHSFADVTTTEKDTSGIALTPPSGSSGFAESQYCNATFNLSLPLGEYRIYAIANYTPTEEQMASEKVLKSVSFNWNHDVAVNDVMFGYFTNGNVDVPSYSGTENARFAAPTVRIDKSNVTLHAWVRRVVSKVTVGFDGTNLNENVYIYIHSVQIKDIPQSVCLGKDNKPTASGLNVDGETIWYKKSSSSVVTEGLRVTRGVPTGISMADGTVQNNGDAAGGVHHEAANSLFLFENLQGDTSDKGKWQDSDGNSVIDHPNGGNSNDPDYKDGKGAGSYIEVKGYYVNKTSTDASQGDIVYRFMLGKDTEKNCDVERSNHYKVTLQFNKNANDVDWHIEYVAESPELAVPSPLYISYGYNEYLDIPIVIQGQTVTDFSAEIIDNPWGYDEHKYSAYQTENYNGFLSFQQRTDITISEAERRAWANSTEQKITSPTSTSETGTGWNYKVRVWTRPLTLQTSFTGHNPFTGHERIAKVRVKATVDGVEKTIDTEVIQVRRAVNPAGVWRSGNKQTPFEVKLMEMDGEDTDATGYLAKDFFPTISDGPWSAEIIKGEDWVQIKTKDSQTWGNTKITGSTGTEICFDYRPGNTIDVDSYRGGVIKVLYHNYNCVHYIFVSQGLGTVNLAGTNWQTRNVEYNGKLVANPLLEGSMFKFGDSNKAVLPENNITYGWKVETARSGKMKPYKVYDTYNRTTPDLMTDANYSTPTFDPDGFTSMSVEGGVPPTKTQWVALESLRRYYGVMYGDECTETIDRTVATYDPDGTDAYMYMAVEQKKGMQGVFIWDDSRGGNHTFFPLSSTGFGHRKAADLYMSEWGLNPANKKFGVLQYGQRSSYFPDTGEGITIASSLPVFYDLWLRKGVIYWYRERVKRSGTDGTSHTHYDYAHDFNYFTMGLDSYLANNMYVDGSFVDCDLCLMRCVVN